MAPEMAIGYVIGWIPSLTVTGLHFHLHRKKIKSLSYRQLQINLIKVGLLWRESQSNIEQYIEGKEERDLKAYEKNLILMGTFFFFLSWAGFVFNLLMLISMHSIAISRFEQRIFSSDLTKKELTSETVLATLEEVRNL